MKAGKLNVWLLALICCSALFGAAAAARAQSPGNGIDSVANSYVYLNHAISPDDCSMRNAPQTFCFQAISYTDDYDWIFYLWMRFPASWTVHNVVLSETPYCVNGGTFGDFSYSMGPDNAARITHVRYHSNPSDTCTAYYCFQVTPGDTNPGVNYDNISWYWQSSQYGSTPYFPCSSDGFTPFGQPACDESITPPAYINRCPQIYLPVMTR